MSQDKPRQPPVGIFFDAKVVAPQPAAPKTPQPANPTDPLKTEIPPINVLDVTGEEGTPQDKPPAETLLRQPATLAVDGSTSANLVAIDMERTDEDETDEPKISGYITSEPVPDPNLTKPEKKLNKLFDPDIDEHLWCILRLYKLKNQLATKELKELTTSKTLEIPISQIAQLAAIELQKNLEKQKNRTGVQGHLRSDHYYEGGFQELDKNTANIHKDIAIINKDPKTIITLPTRKDSKNNELPARTITTWPEDHNKRIMYSSSGTDPYALIVFMESVLKGAKQLLQQGMQANFVIFIPQNDMAAIAQLCAMANFVGLKPIFQTKPNYEAEAKTFNNTFIEKYGTPQTACDQELEHPTYPRLQELLEIIKLKTEYKPPEHTKYLGKKP